MRVQTSLARTSRAEQVARSLEREIVEQHEPRDRLGTKEDLRVRFGVAVGTINEAVRLLETRDLIDVRPGPGGGVFVSRPTARAAFGNVVLGIKSGSISYEECMEVREGLEPLIDRHAARYHRATDIRAMRRLLIRMEDAIEDPTAAFAVTRELHRRIATLCRNRPLRAMYVGLIDYLTDAVRAAEYDAYDGPSMLHVHRALVDGIEAGEGQQLEAAVSAHAPAPAHVRRV